MATKYLPS